MRRSRGRRGTRPRILVLNQYYAPGREATAQLLRDLCAGLASEWDVTVIAGLPYGVPSRAGRSSEDGVDVVRVRSATFNKAWLALRALNYLTYLAQALYEGLRTPRPDVVLCMTDPPVVGDVALLVARRFRASLVLVSQDVFPETAMAVARIDNELVVRLLRRVVDTYLTRADRVVAIGEGMRERLERKGVDPSRLRVIPNWTDTEWITPRPRDNEWARRHGLVDRFVVMHSGNVGHAQDLETLVRAASLLRDLSDLTVVIVGGGARYEELVRLARSVEADNVRFLPYQPREVLADSLAAADVHVVGLARGLAGYVVPSRLYGILAAGRPAIVAAESESDTAQLALDVGFGTVVPPARPDLLASEIRKAYAGELDLPAMGRRGREYATTSADRNVALSRYRALVRELVAATEGEAAA